MTAVKQAKAAELTATLSAEVDSVKPADFQVVRDESKAVIPVKNATIGDDKKTVTITTYAELKDSKEYTVTYTNPKVTDTDKQKSEAKFTSTNGEIAKVSLAADTVTVGKETEIKFNIQDANDVVLDETTLSGLSSRQFTHSEKFSNNKAYLNVDKLYLPTVGDTATFTVTYHTYKYNGVNEEGTFTNDLVVTAVAENVGEVAWNYTIIKGAKAATWTSSDFKANNVLNATPGVTTLDNAKYNVWFNFKDSKGNDRTGEGYSISSSDTSILIVDNRIIKNNGTGYGITGVKEGSAYIIVKDKNGTVVQSLPVTVRPKAVATSLRAESGNSIRISNTVKYNGYLRDTTAANYHPESELRIRNCYDDGSASASIHANYDNAAGEVIVDQKSITFKIYDQYNEEMDIDAATVDVELRSANVSDKTNDNTALANLARIDLNNVFRSSMTYNDAKNPGVVTVYGRVDSDNDKQYDDAAINPGTYVYEISAKNTDNDPAVTSNLTVTVAQPDAELTPTYEVRLVGNNGYTVVDANDNVDLSDVARQELKVYVAELRNGLLYDYCDVEKDANGNGIGKVGGVTFANAGIHIATNKKSEVIKLDDIFTYAPTGVNKKYLAHWFPAGSYTITVSALDPYDEIVPITSFTRAKVFNLTETKKSTANVKKTDAEKRALSNILVLSDWVQYTYDDKDIPMETTPVYLNGIDRTTLQNSDYYVRTADILVPVTCEYATTDADYFEYVLKTNVSIAKSFQNVGNADADYGK